MALAVEQVMFFDRDEAIAISGRPAIGTCFALPAKSDTHTVVDSGRNWHAQLDLFGLYATAATRFTSMFDNRTVSVAGGTGRLHAKNTCRLDDLAGSATPAARFARGSGPSSISVARIAERISFESDRFLNTGSGFFERQRNAATNVVSPAGRSAAPSATEEVTEHAPGEHVAKGFEDIFDVVELSGCSIDSGMPEPIVSGSLFRTRQHLVRLGRLFEPIGGLIVAGVAVRMILDRQLPISVGDLLI